ncbi:MAG: DUF721 domain-containing protein [Treponema sp.]|jgi:hypothetical protein|nr:DUF721 domain-containing protein [Treponema sp.]
MKRVGDVLSVIFDEGLIKKAKGYSSFFSCWKDLTEKNGIAAAGDHSWIQSLDRGLVWIEVDHPGWKQILQTKESKLLSDFHYRFPEMDISGISIVLCRPGARSEKIEGEPIGKAAAEPVMPEKAPSAEQPETVPEEYTVIKDGALKDALMRLEQSIAEKE